MEKQCVYTAILFHPVGGGNRFEYMQLRKTMKENEAHSNNVIVCNSV